MTKRERNATDPDSRSNEQVDRPSTALHVISVFTIREIRTIFRTRSYLLLIGVIAASIAGIAMVSSGLSSGYSPVIADLMTPMEFLIPLVAVAFGYKSILGDSQRGELDTLQTYPITATQQVVGVFFGRALGVVVSTLGPLLLLGFALTVSTSQTWVFATPTGVDSPVLFVRFMILSVLFALVVLAMAIGVSGIVTTPRSGLVSITILLTATVVIGDLLVISGIASGWISDSVVVYVTGFIPNSAYRGLMLETVLGTATTTKAASAVVNLVGLCFWGVIGLTVAIFSLKARYPSQR